MRGTLLFCRIWSWGCRLFLEQTEAHPPFLHACHRSSKSSPPHLSLILKSLITVLYTKTWTWVQSSKVLSFWLISSHLIVKWQMQKQLGSAGGKKSSLLLLLLSLLLLFLQRLKRPVAGALNSSGLITCHPTRRKKTCRQKPEIYSHKVCKLFLLLHILLLLQSHGS